MFKGVKGKRVVVALAMSVVFLTLFSACGASEVTNEEFLESLGEGLTARWEAGEKIDDNDTDTYLQEITAYDACIQAEWDVIKEYQNREFTDAEFGELASGYLTYMQNAKDAYEYKEDYVTYFAEVDKGIGGATDILTTFAEQYDLYDYIDRAYWGNLEQSTGVCKQIPTSEITNTDWEGIYEVSIKLGGTYQLRVRDVDKETKECGVDFRTEDDEWMTACKAMILDNSRLYFELQGKDDSQPTKFTINVTEEDGEELYSLNLINEEYESDDDQIYGFVLDYKVAYSDIIVTRMTEEEWEQKKEEEEGDLIKIGEDSTIENEAVPSDNSGTFVGMEGTYICTSTPEGEWTGRVDVSEISGDSLKVVLGILEGPADIMTEYAQIIDSNTAQLTTYGVTLTFTWTDAENMSISRDGEFTGGTDAGTMEGITDNQSYIRSVEFN